MRIGILISFAILTASCTSQDQLDERFTRWTRYEAEPGATSFSALDQINRENVDQLEMAWIYEPEYAASMNPIVVDSTMYVIGADDQIIALHAGTGVELWKHASAFGGAISDHGIMYWESENRSDRRILFHKGSYHLVAVDAVTGEAISSFGNNGGVDLREGLSVDPETVVRATSPTPGVVFEDLVVLGSSPGEGYIAPPGDIRAFDVRTGRQVWAFHTLPKPGEFGYDTWPEGRSDDGGGANSWGGMSVDDERGIVYVPLGSANYDFYGVDRPGQNLFANSLVALDARTGERIWHFQTVHHDLWDYDLTATPVLLTVDHEGESLDIVVLATKTGLVFAFDRVTGKPLWPIEERDVPPSTMPDEQAWPTQPFPTRPEPFVPLTMDIDQDLNPHMDPADRDSIVTLLKSMAYAGMFTPPGTQPTLQMPGNRGGANFASTAGDPRDGTFFVISYNMPSVLKLEAITAEAVGTGGSFVDMGHTVYKAHCQICHRPNREGQPMSGIPSLVGVTDRLSHDEFRATIRGGKNLMPAFPQLVNYEFEALVAYLSNPDLILITDDVVASEEVPNPAPVRYQSGWNHILDSKGVPAIKPPWFRITAYDMNTGTIKWQAPVGEVKHLVEKGIENTGAGIWVRGGPAVTAGGLVFQPAGEKLWALDSETGEKLWEADLPGTGEGKPTVYQVGGQQFIAVAATEGIWGHPRAAVRRPAYVAFALPLPGSSPRMTNN